MSKEIDELKAEIAQLRAEVERANPPAPPKFEAGPSGPTTSQIAMSRVSMPVSVMREMANAIGDGTIKEIVKSGALGVLQTVGGGPTPTRVSAQNTSGWRDPGPLGPPPGIAIADRLMDVQDARDRAQLIANEARRLAKK
jgi:hypothetical protein